MPTFKEGTIVVNAVSLIMGCIKDEVNKKYKIPLTCLGVTPGIRTSNAKSEASIGITGRVVPRHSLENDLVVSLNLKKRRQFQCP